MEFKKDDLVLVPDKDNRKGKKLKGKISEHTPKRDGLLEVTIKIDGEIDFLQRYKIEEIEPYKK